MSTFLNGMDLPLDTPLRPRDPKVQIPLSPLQQSVWDYSKNRVSTRWFGTAIRFSGNLDTENVRRSLEIIVHRHETLRTRIVSINEVAAQQIDEAVRYTLVVKDLSHLPITEAERKARKISEQLFGKEIDWAVGPLFEAQLLKLASADFVLVLALDHMITDGISNDILVRELLEVYGHLAHQRPVRLPKLPVQFGDYAVWQKSTHRDWLLKEEAYWRRHLAGVAVARLPFDRASKRVAPSRGEILKIRYEASLVESLRKAARRERVMLPFLMLAIYAVTMSSWCNETDLLIMLVEHGRDRWELNDLIGFIAGHLYLRIELSRNEPYQNLLKRITGEFLAACAHRDFNRVPQLIPELSTSLYFNWQSTRPPVALSGLKVELFPTTDWLPAFDLGVFFYDEGSCFQNVLAYNGDLFAERTVRKFGARLQALAEEFVRSPQTLMLRE
jgi:hypothetical protein